MKRTFNFKKGIFILLVVAATMASCSKDNDNPSTKVPQGAYGVFIGFAEITSDNYQNITSANFPDLKSGKGFSPSMEQPLKPQKTNYALLLSQEALLPLLLLYCATTI